MRYSRALVTGASGFVGSHLAAAVAARGAELRCLLRPSSNRRWLKDVAYEEVTGALDDVRSLEKAVAGVDVVFHCAGVTKARNEATYFYVNAKGTENLARACLKRETTPLFIYVSSQAAAGPCREEAPKSEVEVCEPITAYGRSKLAGEDFLRGCGGSMPFVILRPSAVYGPRDTELLTYFKFIARGVEPVIGWGDRYVSVCYITDLVDAILLAAEKEGARGQTYFIAHDEVWDWHRLGQMAAEAMGVKTRRLMVPKALLFGAATIAELAASFAGKAATLNREKARDLSQKRWVCDIGKAKRELGFTPRVGFAEGARLTVAWYRQQGWL